MQRDGVVRGVKSFKVDVERVVDDFVLLCILAGNDFLPGMLNQYLCMCHCVRVCSLVLFTVQSGNPFSGSIVHRIAVI